MASIHSTAIVDPQAELAGDVKVGPYCIIESDVRIGAGCWLREHVVVRRFTTLGENNVLDSFVVLGGEPQDYNFDRASETYLRIGDENTFREGVTISRATGQGQSTVVGNRTYWMTTSHAGHNAVIEDDVILVNNCAIAGYAWIGRGCNLSGHSGAHQYTRVGELVMMQGNAICLNHVPPYTIVAGINRLAGLNVVGLRRAKHLTDEDRRQIKDAFRLTYRSGLTPSRALEAMEACSDWGEAAGKFRDFIRWVLTAEAPYNRGLCRLRKRGGAG